MSKVQAFPIYDELAIKAANVNSLPSDWYSSLVNLPSSYAEIILGLIIHHSILNNAEVKTTASKKNVLPYKGKIFENNVGVIYNIEYMPENLRKIIYCFVVSVSA